MRVLTEQFRHRLGRSPAPAEARSWERSLAVLAADLVEADLGGVEALVEYQLPLMSKRVDVILCGVHPRTGAPSYVVIELKQWSRAHVLDGADDVCVLEGLGELLHPVEQVRRYCTYLADFAASLSDHPEWLSGAAYLHNATDLDVDSLWHLAQSEHGRMFTGQRRGAFLEFLRARLSPESGAESADQLMSSAVKPSPARRTGEPQVDELIDAARVPVFLLDEHQVVRPGEIGTVADIEAAARRLGVGFRHVSLDGQFRCGGSRAYEEWVLRLLGLAPGGPSAWEGDEHFWVTVAESPGSMEGSLRQLLDRGYGARIAAGYCWDWSDPVKGGGLVADVQIGDWHKPWNNKKQTAHAGAPGTPFWASDPAGFEQVGCVYTAQGFEYDYSGVIIGPDLVWRGDHFVSQSDRSRDTQVKRGDSAQFDRAVRNTYKVLLTRGMLGSILYSTDSETQELLQSVLPSLQRS
ncbi:MAG: DUF2075 domain-containing protein [Actinomycetota bacterium]|nr:DUF2075 domain-containing protein [Actinomycetota bacterium]